MRDCARVLGPKTTVAPFDTVDLQQQLAALDAERDIVIVAGGDGTLNRVVNGMARALGERGLWPRVAFLAMGSANDTGRSINEVTGRPADVKALAAVLVSEAPLRSVHIGRLRCEGNPDAHYFVNFASLGLGADWARISESAVIAPIKKLSPTIAYGLCTAAVIAVNSGAHIALEHEPEPARRRRSAVFFLKGRYLLGMDLGPTLSLEGPWSGVLAIDHQSRGRLVRLFRATRRGEGAAPSMVRAARLRLEDGPPWVNLDGEPRRLQSAAPVTLEVDAVPGLRLI